MTRAREAAAALLVRPEAERFIIHSNGRRARILGKAPRGDLRIAGGDGGFAARTVTLIDLAWVAVASDDFAGSRGLLDEARVNWRRYLEGAPRGSTRSDRYRLGHRGLVAYHRSMNTEQALEILQDVFCEQVDAVSPSWSRQLKLSFYHPDDGGPTTASMTIYRGDEIEGSGEQPVELLPTGAAIDPARYRTFAEGVRDGMGAHYARYEGMTGPAEVFLVDLLRNPSLRTPADFARAVADDEAQARALASIQISDYAQRHGLSPLVDDATCRFLWTILREHASSEPSARALVASERLEAIPLLVTLLDEWVDSGYVQQPVWFLPGGNGHVLLARILEPLVRRTHDPELARRVAGLADAGLFEVP